MLPRQTDHQEDIEAMIAKLAKRQQLFSMTIFGIVLLVLGVTAGIFLVPRFMTEYGQPMPLEAEAQTEAQGTIPSAPVPLEPLAAPDENLNNGLAAQPIAAEDETPANELIAEASEPSDESPAPSTVGESETPAPVSEPEPERENEQPAESTPSPASAATQPAEREAESPAEPVSQPLTTSQPPAA
jgi:hypothetical protein